MQQKLLTLTKKKKSKKAFLFQINEKNVKLIKETSAQ